jgi:hypothetical protein
MHRAVRQRAGRGFADNSTSLLKNDSGGMKVYLLKGFSKKNVRIEAALREQSVRTAAST